MRPENWVRLAIIRFCLWQANRYVRKSERFSQREMDFLRVAEAWTDCARQNREALERSEAP